MELIYSIVYTGYELSLQRLDEYQYNWYIFWITYATIFTIKFIGLNFQTFIFSGNNLDLSVFSLPFTFSSSPVYCKWMPRQICSCGYCDKSPSSTFQIDYKLLNIYTGNSVNLNSTFIQQIRTVIVYFYELNWEFYFRFWLDIIIALNIHIFLSYIL